MDYTNTPATSTRLSRFLMLLAMICIIILLSIFVFSEQSLRLDEAQSLWQTSHTPIKILQIIGEDVHVPFYHMMLHFWQVFFGNGVATARLLSLFFYILMIPAIYKLGSLAYNRSIGLFGALLISISPFMNWYGNEIRMYSLFALLIILNQYFFISIFKEEKKSSWWGYGITAVLGAFTHYYFFLNLFSQALYFFVSHRVFPKGSFRKFVVCAVILTLFFVPWLINVAHQGGTANMQPLLQTPTSVNVFNTFSQFIFGFQDDHINTIFISLWPLAILLAFLSLRKNHHITSTTLYFLVAIIIPIFVTFSLSFVFRPLFVTRYLILTLPALYLFLSSIIWSYPKAVSYSARALLIVIMVAGLGIESLSALTPIKENYRDAAMYLQSHATPEDAIVVSAPFTIFPVEYYYRGPINLQTLPMWDRYKVGPIPAFADEKLPQEVDTIKDSRNVLWLLLSYDQGYEEKIRIYFDTHYQRLDQIEFSPGMHLYSYKLKY